MLNRPFGNAYKVAMATLGNTVINGAENASIQSGIEKAFVFADGATTPRMSYIQTISPVFSFSTMNLSTFMQTGWRGLPLSSFTGGLSIYLKKLMPNSTEYSGANHLKWSVEQGIIYPTALQVSTKGVASVSYTVGIASQDQVWPLVSTDNASLPALGDITCYGLGPTVINGEAINTVEDVNLNINPNAISQAKDGDIYARCFYLSSAQPQFQINMTDISYASDDKLGVTGTCDFATTKIYLQRRMRGSEYFPGTDAVHAAIQFGGDYYFPTLAAGNATDLATNSLTIDVVQHSGDSSNDIVIAENIMIPNTAWPQSPETP